MKMESPQKRFENALLELSRHQQLADVFSDYLDYSLLMMRWWNIKAAHFTLLEHKYPEQKQQQLFAEAYYAMGEVAEQDGSGFKDPFGDFYMEHLSNGRQGQFFTPESLCDMIAQMQIGDNLPDDATIADPCCGSGRLLLSAAKINRKARFYAFDIDPVCCKMTAINFLLNTMCGEVHWANTITQEYWRCWETKKVMNGNGFYLPYYLETSSDQATNKSHPPDVPRREPTKTTQRIKNAIKQRNKKGGSSQLILFTD